MAVYVEFNDIQKKETFKEKIFFLASKSRISEEFTNLHT